MFLSYVSVKLHIVVGSVRGCGCVDCDRFVLYNIFWRRLQANKKISLYVEAYEYVEVYDGL